MDSMHDYFRVSSVAPQLPVRRQKQFFPTVSMSALSMAFYTRCLQELPRITVNDVNRIVRLASVTPSSKKEKGFKLYVSSYIDNFEGTYSQANVS